MTILRIIVESALIYTVVMLTITILYYVGHPSQVIVQHMVPPVVGIVFVLIAVRTHVAKSSSDVNASNLDNSDPLVPSWLSGDDDHSRQRSSIRRSVPIVTTTREEFRMEVLPSRKDDRQRQGKSEWDSDERSEV
ncbi:hypothetical protein NMY22_g9746 [Coprinellus aureogranulatus]|nr:hypothetical protein NMY22_g9746 [Coprinellus aureogranulatus]